MKTMNKNIKMEFSQQTFGFEQSNQQNLKQEVLAFIDAAIADKDKVTFDQVANHFCMQSDRWTKPLIRSVVKCLLKDDKIHFIIAGKKFLSENIKTSFFDSAGAQSKLQIIDNCRIVNTHLSEPARWRSIEIIKPTVIEESVLLKAQHLGQKLFATDIPLCQNNLCRNLRVHLRMWQCDLATFQKIANAGDYPGVNKIRKCIDLLNELLNVHDPSKFIETFLTNKGKLFDAYSNFVVLNNFYKNHVHIWDELIQAVAVFEPNRMLLEKNPDVNKALEAIYKILKNPEPYSMIKEIKGLIATVKIANDPIIEEQIASAKALAIERIEKKIDKLVKVLDEKNANSDIRNKVLFPLQTGKKKINMASNFQSITDYLEDAIDQFDNAMEILN